VTSFKIKYLSLYMMETITTPEELKTSVN